MYIIIYIYIYIFTITTPLGYCKQGVRTQKVSYSFYPLEKNPPRIPAVFFTMGALIPIKNPPMEAGNSNCCFKKKHIPMKNPHEFSNSAAFFFMLSPVEW